METMVKQFAPAEWGLYKTIRLRALQSDPSVFSSSYGEMAAQPDTYWRGKLENTDNGIFGLFHEETLIGMAGIYVEDKISGHAWLGSSWLEKEWRNKGLSKKLFEARIQWARHHPALKNLFVAHREDNVSSRKAILKNGFQFDRADNTTWPDGKTGREMIYKLELEA